MKATGSIAGARPFDATATLDALDLSPFLHAAGIPADVTAKTTGRVRARGTVADLGGVEVDLTLDAFDATHPKWAVHADRAGEPRRRPLPHRGPLASALGLRPRARGDRRPPLRGPRERPPLAHLVPRPRDPPAVLRRARPGLGAPPGEARRRRDGREARRHGERRGEGRAPRRSRLPHAGREADRDGHSRAGRDPERRDLRPASAAERSPSRARAGLSEGKLRRVDATLRARDLELEAGKDVQVRAGADLAAKGEWPSPAISGEVRLDDVVYNPSLDAGELLKAFKERGRRATASKSTLPPFVRGLALDVAVIARDAIHLEGNLGDAELGGNLRVKGTVGEPVVLGSISSTRGELYVLGSSFDLSRAGSTSPTRTRSTRTSTSSRRRRRTTRRSPSGSTGRRRRPSSSSRPRRGGARPTSSRSSSGAPGEPARPSWAPRRPGWPCAAPRPPSSARSAPGPTSR